MAYIPIIMKEDLDNMDASDNQKAKNGFIKKTIKLTMIYACNYTLGAEAGGAWIEASLRLIVRPFLN